VRNSSRVQHEDPAPDRYAALIAIGRSLREQYDAAAPIPPYLAALVKEFEARDHPISNAAATRLVRSGSLRMIIAMSAPKRTPVSRSADTIAIGATVIAQMAMP
jgi:hypothetical protein